MTKSVVDNYLEKYIMGHMLETIGNDVSMAYVGEVPWHGLGQSVEEGISPQEIAIAARADWRVVKQKLRTETGKIVRGSQALVREYDGRVLTVVGDRWNPIQNEEAFAFFKKFCDAGSMSMHTAGVIDNNNQVTVWALAKLRSGFTLANGDSVEGHLLFSNPHQVNRSAVIEFTPIRVVCNNTLTLALQKGNYSGRVAINHKNQFDPSDVEVALGLADEKMETYRDAARFLASKSFEEQTVLEYFNRLFPLVRYGRNDKQQLVASLVGTTTEQDELEQAKEAKKAARVKRTVSKNAERLNELLIEQPGANMSAGSWWSAFNAGTYFLDHEFGRTSEARLQSAWFGANRRLKNKALRLAVEYAEAA